MSARRRNEVGLGPARNPQEERATMLTELLSRRRPAAASTDELVVERRTGLTLQVDLTRPVETVGVVDLNAPVHPLHEAFDLIVAYLVDHQKPRQRFAFTHDGVRYTLEVEC